MPQPFFDQRNAIDSERYVVLMLASTTFRGRYPTSASSIEAMRHAVSGNAPAKNSSEVHSTQYFTGEFRGRYPTSALSIEAIRRTVSGNAPAKYSSEVLNAQYFAGEKSLYNRPSLEAMDHPSFCDYSC